MPKHFSDDESASKVSSEAEPPRACELEEQSHGAFPTLPQIALSPTSSSLCKARVREALFHKVEPIRVSHFILLQRLGAGAMGEIYEAFDELLDRRVALKLVLHGSSVTPESDDLLVREARALAQVSHPNVVQIFEVGTHENRPFIAMELVRGQTLTSWVNDAGQMPRLLRRREILRRFIAAGRGLEAAHAAGVAHRDFKPDNVLVGEDGRVRVVDFGLARVVVPGPYQSTLGRGSGTHRLPSQTDATLQSDTAAPRLTAETRLTRTGTVMGTPRFMAPEQIRGEMPDHRSDQFSFCVALYHALYDAFPFHGEDPKDLLASIESGVGGLEHSAGLGARLRKALCRGLSVEPSQRYAHMGELLGELESILRCRRGWIAGAVLLLALGAGFYILAPRQDDPCAHAGEGMETSWSFKRQLTTQVAFARTLMPYAWTTWKATRQRLDDYSSRWRSAAKASCRARYVSHEESEVQFQQRTICLRRAHGQVDALVSELERGASDTV
ncbi:MAG: serine/threonine-protein kinase, partial [bacterium]